MNALLPRLFARRSALLRAFFRRDARGDHAGADSLAPAIERVQRAIERVQSEAT